MRIGITYNLKSDLATRVSADSTGEEAEEFDLPETIEALQKALAFEADSVFLLGGDLGVIDRIRENQIDFVFNIAEGFSGRSRESHLPALLEMLGVPYSGSDPVGLGLTLDKSLAKRMAISLGIPTPEFWVLETKEDVSKIPDRFPLFVKPLWQGSSIGIRRSSRVQDRPSLEREAGRLFGSHPGESVLAEEYIPGREVTVGILGNKDPEILGLMEITFRDPSEKDFCYSLEVKRDWKALVDYHVPPRLDFTLRKRIEESAIRLFQAMGLRDFARMDFRVTAGGAFYFLEANPLPGLHPGSGDLVILARKKGWSYEELVLRITRFAVERYPELSSISK
ncbi:MAG: D-alanine--D-alanine ligase [Candidatus Omnitrophica bacterium]|nr:D-alanine--D-alanine ligase [Candidatus Omnitrophota bacterium]